MLSETEHWLTWNCDLDHPNDSEDDWAAEVESNIEPDVGIEDPEGPEQWDMSATPNIPGLIRPTWKSKRLAENVLLKVNTLASAKNISVWAECLCQSGRALSGPWEIPWWRITLRPASISRVWLHIALRSRFHCFFWLCPSPILNEHSGIVAKCDHMAEWVHWVHACFGIATWWVMLRKPLTPFHLPGRKMQFSQYQIYTSFQVTRSMWLLTIHRLFRQSPVLLWVAISGIMCALPTTFPTLKTCKATAASAVLTYTNFETGSELPEFLCILVIAKANQYSTKAPFLFRNLILNSCCSCHKRRPFSAPLHLPRRCVTHTQSFRQSPLLQLWLPVHQEIWVMHSPSKPSTWTLIQW